MSRYGNGQIPAHLLMKIGPYRWLTKATAARWHALVADILKHEGVTMRITPGKNAYRDYEGQVFARQNACARGRCNDAAVAGTSSHGGEYRGRDSMAIDVQNWGVLGKDKWYAYCREHGFDPGFFDWEPWHIIDWNPWVMPAASGGGGIEDEMTPEQARQLNSIFNAIFRGGESMADGKRSVSASLALIHGKLADVNRGGKSVSLRQEIADTKTKVFAMEAAVQALATANGADPAAILAAVESGVKEAMKDVTFSVDVDA